MADKEAQAKCKLEALLSAYSNAFVAARAVLRHELANGTTEVNGRRWLTAEALERVIRAMEGCDAAEISVALRRFEQTDREEKKMEPGKTLSEDAVEIWKRCQIVGSDFDNMSSSEFFARYKEVDCGDAIRKLPIDK